MKNFEWLLRDLGWVKMDRGEDCPDDFKYYTDRYGDYPFQNWHWHDNEGNCHHDVESHEMVSYNFIASIPITSSRYYVHLGEILGFEPDWNISIPSCLEAIHSAPLDARIEAHCRARGME